MAHYEDVVRWLLRHERRQGNGAVMRVLFTVLVLFGITGLRTSSYAQSGGWFWQNPQPRGNTLYAAAVLDPSTIVAVGTSRTILRTTDSGVTWTSEPSGTI